MYKLYELLPNHKYIYNNIVIYCEHIICDDGYETNIIHPVSKINGTELTKQERTNFNFLNFSEILFNEYEED